jgi:DNA topoisomerase-1
MINAASTALKLTSDRITACAQKLYENGLITYLRTDATFIADSAFSLIKEYGQDNQLPMVDVKNEWSSTEGAQEAHECIRPSDISIKETDLGNDENNLYKLIWQRTIASQMQPAVYDTHTIELTPTADINYPVTYNATASTLTSAGWTTIYNDLEATENDEQASLPELTEGVTIDGTATVLAKKTRAPKRFTDASLPKELDSRGIGRPSTYASLVKGLLAKKYLVQDKKLYLTPTQSGADVYMALRGQFAFLNANYTKELEKCLDVIAEGGARYKGTVKQFHGQLDKELKNFMTKIPDAIKCPKCEHPLSKRGDWWGCTNFPDCKHTKDDDNGKPVERKPKAKVVLSEFDCTCGSKLIRRKSAPKKKGAKKKKPTSPYWYGCSNYPKCNKSFQEQNGKPLITQGI